MTYLLTREELLEFSKIIYEQSIHSYLDLKDSTCERMLSNFLIDKKTSMPNTNLTMRTNSVSASQTPLFFNSDIYTITETFMVNQTH
jgi:hypothetical protein